jgi:uncharacterized protein (DUF488 family)
MQNRCFTVGHSTHDVTMFIDLLRKHDINCIIDVRSSPYSRYANQYNKEVLNHSLKEANIVYLFLGDQLGARYEDKNLLFDDGKVDFKKVAASPTFQEGIQRVKNGMIKGYNIALMCSEKEPFDCHRFALVSKSLVAEGIEVNHITPDSIFTQNDLEERLFKKYKLSRYELFSSPEENLEAAYRLRNQDIAYNAITKEGDDE